MKGEVSMTGQLTGRVALVTGAASGIGRAVAERFLAEGAVVIGGDVQEAQVPYPLLQLDVSDPSSWKAALERTHEFGPLDALVNVAGTTGQAPIHETSDEDWQRIIAVNQTGTFNGMRSAIKTMLEHHTRGSIVNVASIFSTRAVSDLAAYHASKAAVVGMTRNAAVTYARAGIRVNAVAPGWISTPMTATQPSEMNQSFIDSTPMGTGGSPTDIAAGVLYLTSEEAAYVTGVVLPIDGGYLAR